MLNANKDTCRSTARCCAAQRVLQPKGRLKTFIPIKATFFFFLSVDLYLSEALWIKCTHQMSYDMTREPQCGSRESAKEY